MHTYLKSSKISFIGRTIFFETQRFARSLLFKRIIAYSLSHKIFLHQLSTSSGLPTHLLVLQEKICQEEDSLYLFSSYVSLLQFHDSLTSHLVQQPKTTFPQNIWWERSTLGSGGKRKKKRHAKTSLPEKVKKFNFCCV